METIDRPIWGGKETKGLVWAGVLTAALLVQYALVWHDFIQGPEPKAMPGGTGLLMLLSGTESLFEEVIFRLMPLYVVVRYLPRASFLIVASALSSAIFGLYHVKSPAKVELMISGLVYSGVFIASGGIARNFKKALFSSWVTHAILNLSWIIFRLP